MPPKAPTQRHACERCRTSKLRCLVDTVKSHDRCRRCHDADVECIFESMAPRQKRKRIDTRLSALEAQVRALQGSSTNYGRVPQAQGGEGVPDDPPSPERSSDSRGSSTSSAPSPELPSTVDGDTIPGLLSIETLAPAQAVRLLEDFKQHALPEYPVLSLSHPLSFRELCVTRPTLLLALITAGARGTDPILFDNLHQRLIRHLSEEVVIEGKRSIELLQAVLIAEIWYNPPSDLRRLNFYLWIQIAATMASQLGLWWDPRMLETARQHTASEADLERLRAGACAYLCMSTVAVSSRRSRMVDLNEDVLEAHGGLCLSTGDPNDLLLHDWLQIQKVSEEVGQLRALSTHSLPDQGTSLSRLEDRLSNMTRNGAEWTVSLRIHHHWTRIQLGEMQLRTHMNIGNASTLTAGSVRAITSIMQDCHDIIDTLLQSATVTYLHCPTVTTVRALYAGRELLTIQSLVDNEQSPYFGLLTESVVRSKQYLNKLRGFLSRFEGDTGHQVPVMALKLIANLNATGFPRNDQVSGGLNIRENDLDDVTAATLPDVVQTAFPPLRYGQPSSSNLNADQTAMDSSATGQWANIPDLDLLTMPGLDFIDYTPWNG
ncbi:hypothetical protein BDZ85DRAFT_55429 [Elsinoe ampelina]|uniref:Zn(2)-C6 fungal-type domain-containing protein n=1 Tax=Elsinoe ampelina TaxID=302913 RepID=A0A6A6GMK4_9PEZI|nr:hypothetical protein BDZ85DRAFT_55429 [Elsinoe ampelina]